MKLLLYIVLSLISPFLLFGQGGSPRDPEALVVEGIRKPQEFSSFSLVSRLRTYVNVSHSGASNSFKVLFYQDEVREHRITLEVSSRAFRFYSSSGDVEYGGSHEGSFCVSLDPVEGDVTFFSDEGSIGRVEMVLDSAIVKIEVDGDFIANRVRVHQIPEDAVLLGGWTGDPVLNYIYLKSILDIHRGSGKVIHFEPGSVDISCPVGENVMVLEGVQLVGAGTCSRFQHVATEENPDPFTTIRIVGSGTIVSDVAIAVGFEPTVRTNVPERTLLYLDEAVGFRLSHLQLVGASGAGIFAQGCQNGVIAENEVQNCLADGIHLTQSSEGAASHDVEVSWNSVFENGDDGVAVISYGSSSGAEACYDVSIQHNLVRDQTWGRGIAVSGGRDIQILENSVFRSPSAGILVVSEKNYNTLGVERVLIRRNLVVDCLSESHSAIMVTTGNHSVLDIDIVRNVVRNPRRSGIGAIDYVRGEQAAISRLRINGNGLIDTLQDFSIYLSGVEDVDLSENTIVNTKHTSVVVLEPVGSLSIADNTFTNVSLDSAYGDVLSISTSEGSSCEVSILRNQIRVEPGRLPEGRELSFPERFLEIRHLKGYVTIEDNSFESPVPSSSQSVLFRNP